jgi:hypothetical protein
MPMPHDITRKVFEQMWKKKTRFMTFSIANIKDRPITGYEDDL